MKCPQCGFTDEVPMAKIHNIMNEYSDSKTGKVVGVMNSDEDVITTKTGAVLWKKGYTPPKPADSAKSANPAK